VTVSPEQILAAQAKGLINVVPLAKACDRYGFPFYLACVILEKETRGQNVFGHDKGGAMYGAGEVTEAKYREFRRLIDSGQTSQGVGPMQITWKGYFPVMEADGLKPWLPADNILFGVGILSRSLQRGLEQGLSLEKAFWLAAKSYNGNASYADDAVAKAKVWLAAVGDDDMKPEDDDMAITDADVAKIADAVLAELFTKENVEKLARAVWETDDIIPAGADEPNPKNKAWWPSTFLRKTYNNTI
jgi:hypothetical protein